MLGPERRISEHHDKSKIRYILCRTCGIPSILQRTRPSTHLHLLHHRLQLDPLAACSINYRWPCVFKNIRTFRDIALAPALDTLLPSFLDSSLTTWILFLLLGWVTAAKQASGCHSKSSSHGYIFHPNPRSKELKYCTYIRASHHGVKQMARTPRSRLTYVCHPCPCLSIPAPDPCLSSAFQDFAFKSSPFLSKCS